jgi:hypothetical protein
MVHKQRGLPEIEGALGIGGCDNEAEIGLARLEPSSASFTLVMESRLNWLLSLQKMMNRILARAYNERGRQLRRLYFKRLWFHRYVAVRAPKIGAMLGINDIEAIRD